MPQPQHDGVLQNLRNLTVQIRHRSTDAVVGTGFLVSRGGQIQFCREFIGEEGPEAFWTLRDAKWYEASSLQIRYPIDKEMKKEANFTFGFWYRTKRYAENRKRYLNLVTELVQTGGQREQPASKRDREAAFFLIRHTSPTFEEHAVPVDSDFRDVVTRLQQDPTLADLNHKYFFIFPK